MPRSFTIVILIIAAVLFAGVPQVERTGNKTLLIGFGIYAAGWFLALLLQDVLNELKRILGK